ncbi:MAG: tyrosine-type recombinase/integrase [Syntrophothermus sp.]|nr:tyrosine-type recombinase/integrase [Syntrophothermus sp.]
MKQAGVQHARFHDMRHTWATMMLEAGEDLKVVSELGGHSRISTTADTYSHVTVGLKRRAEEKMGAIVERVTGESTPEGDTGPHENPGSGRRSNT